MNAREQLLDRVVDHLARHGIGDTSLRGLATGVGTSHRMLLYHFGSREGLLAAVVERVEAAQRDAARGLDGVDAAHDYWARVVDAALVYGPLFFELASHAMQGREHARALRENLVTSWLEPLVPFWERGGYGDARTHARLGLAVARGLLFDLLLTGDRAAVDAAMEAFVRAVGASPAAPRRS